MNLSIDTKTGIIVNLSGIGYAGVSSPALEEAR
jgi:hypothetical protein